MELLESNQKKHQARALQVERKRFELELSNFDSAKRSIAVDMRKAQTEMKRRLKRYKDRQKEISVSRENSSDVGLYGQFITRPKTASSRLTSRPCTTASSYINRMGRCLGTGGEQDISELDPTFLPDRTRSKIDLRPSSAWSFKSRPRVDTSNLEFRRRGLSLQAQRLGTPASQIRYFDDEEIQERNIIYSHILEQRKKKEKEHFDKIALKVLDFCDLGKKTPANNKMFKSCKRLGCVISVKTITCSWWFGQCKLCFK